MEMTGNAYREGRGTARDPPEAAKWYRRAADAGSAMGAFSLGMLIGTGEAGPKDAPEVVRLMQRAAAGGVASAHYVLANYLDVGHGTGRDREAAARHFVEAARGGSRDALIQFTAAGSGMSRWKPSPELVSALQRQLREAGAYSGPVDGQVTPDFTAVFARLQPGKTP
jgi:TPR repeat protein